VHENFAQIRNFCSIWGAN